VGRFAYVIDIHLAPLLLALVPRLLKVADQLALLGIDANDQPLTVQVSLSLS
jgi:hypothetical protein